MSVHRRLKLALVIAREFRLAVSLILLVIVGGGMLIHLGKGLPLSDAMLAAFLASFFEIIINPPFAWYIQLLLFLSPFVGLYVIADTITTVATMLFGKRHKLQRWWEMVASTYEDHIIVCGVGKVGYRVINELLKNDVMVVGIDVDIDTPYAQELLSQKIPILQGNARLQSMLERVQVRKARSVICVTDDDLTNLDIAFTARDIRPELRIVMRVFDDTIAKKMTQQFALPALSTSYAAAPAFVSEALGLELPQAPMAIYGHTAHIQAMLVGPKHSGKTIAAVEEEEHLKILGYRTLQGKERFPAPSQELEEGAQLIVARLERE